MEFKASLPMIRIAPRKVQFIADSLRGQDINSALNQLKLSPRKKTAEILYKLIKSAAANADQKGTVDLDTLYIKRLLVGQGPTMKRFRPRAKGAASPILKRTSNIDVVLAER